ncbi:unnamed protein product, partial [Adineta steineri]
PDMNNKINWPPVNIVGTVDLVDPAPLTTSWIYYAVGCDLMELLKMHIGRGGTLPYTEDVVYDIKNRSIQSVSTIFSAPQQSSSSNSINKINTVTNSSSIQLGLTSPNEMHIGKSGSLSYIPNNT